MFGEDQCPINYCKFVDYSIMTDCGEEWDSHCEICYEEHMKDMIAMAEEYGKNPEKFRAKYSSEGGHYKAN